VIITTISAHKKKGGAVSKTFSYREISGKKVSTFVSRLVRVALVRTAKARFVTIFIAERNLKREDTLRIRNPPVYRINVQKAVEKKVALSICGIPAV
jgi:hypothetical protein